MNNCIVDLLQNIEAYYYSFYVWHISDVFVGIDYCLLITTPDGAFL